MPTYTFIKERQECGNIDGCKFVGDVFITDDEAAAARLRTSQTFNRTVREITEEEPPAQQTGEDIRKGKKK